jgi:nitroimidazol reductase NimA-like FMN-containing flavoprotein (pyridoxamine 5'-phosphate oxidase superfamily)
MIGNLTDIQIDQLLHREVVGRIGCYADDMIYVVPISYVYKDNNIYAHTNEGLKIDLMRKNPNVCFEVDDLKDMGNWFSVIAWGKFEEISNEAERYAALKLLLNRPLPVISSITTHLGRNWPFYYDDLDMIDGIVFKIELTTITGKFESTTASPVFNF